MKVAQKLRGLADAVAATRKRQLNTVHTGRKTQATRLARAPKISRVAQGGALVLWLSHPPLTADGRWPTRRAPK